MSESPKGIVACHGGLAEALVEAAEEISGIAGVLVPVSNQGCDRLKLEARLRDAVHRGPGIVFVDTPSGSCHFAALHDLPEWRGVKVVSGVNLAMLLEFLFHRELPIDELAERCAGAASRAILVN